ncbi:DUF3078 domain-containing protein [Nibrella saemangeumensis]|uniref:DUF3078 domain-containing protein n=1 Tax=Nibrella saemangeumensis TaxID=1084526 RepID=A0ABP8MSQ9_9BACT
MKKLVFLVSLVFPTFFTVAQDTLTVTKNFADTINVKIDTTYWQRSFSGGVNVNQASFSNWAGGGVNSLALGSVIVARALYEKGTISWDNSADLQLGYVSQRGITRKAADLLFLNSVLGRKLTPQWEAFVSATLSSFFAPGYRYENLAADRNRLLVSSFFSPAQLTLAWGLAYRPADWFSVRISPFAPRFTFVTDDAVRVRKLANGTYVPDPTQEAYGVKAGRHVRTEWLALQLQAMLNRNLSDNFNVSARYLLYANYQTMNAIDHRLDLMLTAKISRYLSTTFSLIGLYDEDFSSGLQLQQTLAIGLLYNVTTFRKK